MTAPQHHWFGQTWSKWRVVPLRTVAQMGTGHTPSRSNEEYWRDCRIPWVTVEDIRRNGEWSLDPIHNTEQHISELGLANSAAVMHPTGTVMLSRTASIGLSCIVGRDMATTQAFVTWTAHKQHLCADYLHAALKAMSQQYDYLAYGATHLTIYFPDLKTLRIPLPPIEDQCLIAAFLKRETAKCDELVKEQQRLIRLLKEKRQAIVSHVVTKGLDPHAPTKESGMEWLGRVPVHWSCAALRHVAGRVVVGIAEAATHAYAETGIPILRSTNVRPGKIAGEILFVDPLFANDRESKRINAGDLVTVRTGNAGVTAVVPSTLDGCHCFTMLITTPSPQVSPDYLCYWMNSVSAQCYFALEGWGTAQVNISVPILKALPVPLPPTAEQREIVAYLDREIEQLDVLVAEAEHATRLIQERRTALISAAVTGQIDVREFAGKQVTA